MTSRPLRAALVVGLVLLLAACGDPSRSSLEAGSGAVGPQSDVSSGEGAVPGAQDTDTSPISTDGGASATTVTGDAGGETAGSVVAGLTVDQVRAAAQAPPTGSARSAREPVLERLVVAGATVWRVRVPGATSARSARATIAVGGRTVGAAIVTADLDAMVALTTDPAALTAGAPVTVTWEGSTPQAVGTLGVAR